MSDLDVINNFERLIKSKYNELGITNLFDQTINGKHTFTYLVSVLESKKDIANVDYTVYNDIKTLTADIQYFIALLKIYHPYINNSITEGCTYIQNIYDRRYLIYCSIIYEKIYNFWDRIGDLLAKFFITGLNQRRIYFDTVINNFPKEYVSSINYKWLLSFKTDEYSKNLNSKRRFIVHYGQIESEHYNDVMYAITRLNGVEKIQRLNELQTEKDGYVDFFIQQLNLCFTGYEKALLLIEEIKI